MRLSIARALTLGTVSLALAAACGGKVEGGGNGNGNHDDGLDAGPRAPGHKLCRCCGTEVEWPANASCGAGACDGYCNFPPDDPPDADTGTQYCSCCGTLVEWPANEDCGVGACDGYCNFAPDACVETGPANDPQCPPNYDYGLRGQPCPLPGLHCSYPGEGDLTDSNGCREPAELVCTAYLYPPQLDGGDEGGLDASMKGYWTPNQ